MIRLLFILSALIFSNHLRAQVYEQVRISDSEKEELRSRTQGLSIGIYHAIPMLGLKKGFGQGIGAGLNYVHEIERVWLYTGVNYRAFKGRERVSLGSVLYDFNKLNSLTFEGGIYIPIQPSERFLILPKFGTGYGFVWHTRIYDTPSYIYKERAFTLSVPIDVGLRFLFNINDKVAIFVEPEMNMNFSFGLYSGYGVESEFSYFRFSDELLAFSYNTQVGLVLLFSKRN